MKEPKFHQVLASIFVCMILLISCTKSPIPLSGENHSYLTPIPQSTLRAYREGTPIANEMDVVIAARVHLSTSRMEAVQTPDVIFVERMTLAEAEERTKKAGVETHIDIPPETPVWFVLFKGKWRGNPPRSAEETTTPPSEFEGCQYVWLTDGGGLRSMGNIDCPIMEK